MIRLHDHIWQSHIDIDANAYMRETNFDLWSTSIQFERLFFFVRAYVFACIADVMVYRILCMSCVWIKMLSSILRIISFQLIFFFFAVRNLALQNK